MNSVSPVVIAILIVISVAFVGAFAAYFRDKRKYTRHEEYSKDAEMLRKKLAGDLFRDSDDLVITGYFNRLRTVIRFSYLENTPGMNIRMTAPVTFGMSIVPRGSLSTEGRVLLRTQDDRFNERFATRSDDPMHAKMFFGIPGVLEAVQKLCCSSRTFVTFTKGAIELSELSVPAPYTGAHILAHLESLSQLSAQLEKLPGAELVKVNPFRREHHLLLRTAIVIGVLAAVAGLIATSRAFDEPPAPEVLSANTVPAGIPPLDSAYIGGLSQWRLAVEADFEPEAANWMHTLGVEPAGRVETDFTERKGEREAVRDAAYLLVNRKDQRRIVLLADGADRFDVTFPYVALLARVPQAAISRIQWAGRPPEQPDGDAILIVRKPQDHASGLVIYLSEGRIVTGVPSDYQTVSLQ